MIPIKPWDRVNWNETDCSWYLEELKKITISGNRYKNWEDELKSAPAVKAQNGTEKPSNKGGKSVTMEQILSLWSRYLEISLDADSVDLLQQQSPEEKMHPGEIREKEFAEKLILSRFPVLYQIWENLMDDSRQKDLTRLQLIGQQMVAIYEEKLSKQDINKAIIHRQRVSVCPYCGIGLVSTRVNNEATAQLDHFFPKKTPPFGIFALCLFNLIPSCGACNHIKREKWLMVSPYDESRSASDFAFRWRPSNPEAYQNLLSNPLQMLDNTFQLPDNTFQLSGGNDGNYSDKTGKSDIRDKKIEIILEERKTGKKESSLTVNYTNDRIYHNGYGNDLITLGIAEKKSNQNTVGKNTVGKKTVRKNTAGENTTGEKTDEEIIVVSYFEDIVKELLYFSFRDPHMDALGRDYERLSFDENALELYEKERQAGRFSEEDYLKYPMSKLYHDISEQIYEEAKV